MDIKTLFSEWQALQPLSAENQKRLDNKFLLEFNYNSNHIEGNTLTYGQTISLLIHGKVEGNAPMRDYEEMKAHHAALEYVKQAAKESERPLTETFIRQVHQIMMKEDYTVYDNRGGNPIQYTVHVGIYKTRPNSVKTQTGELFEYASPEETPSLMTDLVAWYNAAKAEGKLSPLQLASLFHFRYIRIHPFEDGNGRIARLMVNYILASYGYPMIVVHTEDKNNYLSALEKCDDITGPVPSDGAHASLEQITPLVEYLEQCLERALRISIKAAKGENIEEEDDMQKKLAILARNAQAKRGNIKRISNQYVVDIYENFVLPFKDKMTTKLSAFKQFYEAYGVSVHQQQVNSHLLWGLSKESLLNENLDNLKQNGILIKILLSKPSILIPADSVEEINVYVKFDEEWYYIILFNSACQFRYGTVPTDSQQDEWIKQIIEVLYKNTEKKVSEAK
ncbi:MAG: Fic family protein [Paludibacteraceae bacterium]|nr:Fic family protein [Paludibacteraceae bacterium]